MLWTVVTASEAVADEIAALPQDLRAKLLRLVGVIQNDGLDALPHHAVKHLEDKLWELRISGRDTIGRAIYLTAVGRRVVLLRVFVKKTQKTPPRELQLARERAMRLA